LIEKGKAYYCFCSPERLDQIRKAMQEKKEIPRYDRHCRAIVPEEAKKRVSDGEKYVVRMVIPDNEIIGWDDLVRGRIEFDSNVIDDQVILKSDGFPTYHLAVVVDDYLMKISHVLRGEEWISSCPKHVLLYRYFGWELPEFAHMPLLRNKDKSKMSKRKNDVSIFSYKEKGYLPEALINYLSLMGWSHPEEKDIFSYEEYIKVFSIERMQTTGPIFDIEKLNWMNQQYIQNKTDNELKQIIVDFYPQANELATETLDALIPLVKTRMQTLKEFAELTEVFFDAATTGEDTELAHIVKEAFIAISDWNHAMIFEEMKKIMEEKKIRMPVLYKLLIGKDRGLPLPQVLEILGKEKTLALLH
ncbi:MAG TPA: glutamate--tRNA ligase, partial [Patescibacteria group bacterium]|nr:glutamate--tRNA ligase [Patescibacteria group bacterium]